MFHFGFSYVGLIYLLMLFVPNLIWTKHKPEGYDEYAKNENRFFLTLERVGEVLVCASVLLFSDFNIRKTYWSIWLVLSFIFMLFYEAYWLGYFKSRHEMKDFYSSFLGIPVAGATLPVCAFFLLGIYGCNIFLLTAVIILGIGHIGIHLQHRNEILGKRKGKFPIRILKWAAGILLTAIIGISVFIIGWRNVNYFRHYQMIENGVDEGIYVTLGGQEQYVLMRGMNSENPVIIYLHGGPSSPDTYVTYGFTDYLIDEYTVVAWDQRGCGRTYFHNADTDPENRTADFQQAQADLDDLVNYVLERFGKDKVIILGHSYGTILGSEYALTHPDKVSAYIGAAQVVSLEKSDIYSYEDALQKAKDAGDDTSELTDAFEVFQNGGSITDMMKLRALAAKYHPVNVSDKATWMAFTSPYFGIVDFRWFLKQLGDMNEYFELNQQLFDYTFSFDAYEKGLEYKMPVYFISGTCDWICPVDSIREYTGDISAPDVHLELIEGCGHNVQYSSPEEFAGTVCELLKREVKEENWKELAAESDSKELVRTERVILSEPVVRWNGEEGTLGYRWGMDCVSIDETTILLSCDCYFPEDKLQQKIFYVVGTTDFEPREVFRQNSQTEFEGIGADQPEFLEKRMICPVLTEKGCVYELNGVLYRLSMNFKEAVPLCNIRELMGELYEFSPWVPDRNTCDVTTDAKRVLACTNEGLYEYDLSSLEKRVLEQASFLPYEIEHVEGDCDCGETGFEFSGPIKAEYAPDDQGYAFVTGTEYGDPTGVVLKDKDGNVLYQKELDGYCGDFEWVEAENTGYLAVFYQEDQDTRLDMVDAVTGDITAIAVPEEVFWGVDLFTGLLDADHLVYFEPSPYDGEGFEGTYHEKCFGKNGRFEIFQLSNGQRQLLEMEPEEVNWKMKIFRFGGFRTVIVKYPGSSQFRPDSVRLVMEYK